MPRNKLEKELQMKPAKQARSEHTLQRLMAAAEQVLRTRYGRPGDHVHDDGYDTPCHG